MYSLDRIPRGLRLTFGFFYRNAMILCRLLDCRHAQGFTSSAPYSALSYDLQKLLVKVIQHSDAAFFSSESQSSAINCAALSRFLVSFCAIVVVPRCFPAVLSGSGIRAWIDISF